MRLTTVAAALLVLVSAFALTWLKIDTRRLEAQVARDERRREKLQADIAVLKAELAFLTRPERLDVLARRHLGLRPMGRGQTAAPEQLATQIAAQAKARAGLAPKDLPRELP